MNVIVCGQDRCGKSTIVSRLRSVLNSPIIIHSSAPPKENVLFPYDWEYNYYNDVAKLIYKDFHSYKPNTFILDRFHLGVNVYGTKYRGYTLEQVKTLFYDVESYLIPRNTIMFVLTDYGCQISKRDDSGSFEKSPSEYEETRSKFIESFELSSIKNKHLLNITEDHGFDSVYEYVVKEIGKCI